VSAEVLDVGGSGLIIRKKEGKKKFIGKGEMNLRRKGKLYLTQKDMGG